MLSQHEMNVTLMLPVNYGNVKQKELILLMVAGWGIDYLRE